MRAFPSLTVVAAAILGVGACDNSANTPQPTAPTATYGAYPPGYPPPAQGPAQPPPGYPGAYATATPNPAPTAAPYPQTPYAAPTATYPTAPAATGTMTTPGLLALPCQSDATCGLHHCNTQYGKCAFPCQTAADCLSPNQCIMGVCLPGGGT
jgi:hypothetical protein